MIVAMTEPVDFSEIAGFGKDRIESDAIMGFKRSLYWEKPASRKSKTSEHSGQMGY